MPLYVSDQIWAPSVYNEKYFLSFVENPNKKLHTPSIGLSKIHDEYVKKRMAENIKSFVHLSVREEKGREIIKQISGREAKVVLDPTLLLTSEEWDRPAASDISKKYETDKPYILCYFLGTNDFNRSHAVELSRKLGLPLKVIPVFEKDARWGGEILEGVGPSEFISLIKNAALVCTDSSTELFRLVS